MFYWYIQHVSVSYIEKVIHIQTQSNMFGPICYSSDVKNPDLIFIRLPGNTIAVTIYSTWPHTFDPWAGDG